MHPQLPHVSSFDAAESVLQLCIVHCIVVDGPRLLVWKHDKSGPVN